jgi:hypothetical protein
MLGDAFDEISSWKQLDRPIVQSEQDMIFIIRF